jgi:KUP system potassium uptake protein
MVVGALGVVFGDIGTSPIYTIQTAFNLNDPHPVPISTDNVFGVVSLIFWSVMIIVTLTYITLVMRADTTAGAASWRSSRCCGGTAGRGVVAPP